MTFKTLFGFRQIREDIPIAGDGASACAQKLRSDEYAHFDWRVWKFNTVAAMMVPCSVKA